MSSRVADEKRVATGRRNKEAGAAFEGWVESQHVEAYRRGILAFVEKTEPHAKMIGGRLVYVAKGVADYTGCLVGGRCLAVEAKSTADTRLMRSVISSKQETHLNAVTAAGGLALLLVEYRFEQYARFSIPWEDVPWSMKRSQYSLFIGDVQEWRIEPGDCYLSKWHSGGKPIGSVVAVGGRHRVLARE